MNELFRDHKRFLLAALVLHVAIGVLLTANFSASSRKSAPSQLAIQARVIDQSAIRRVQDREKQAEEQRVAKERAAQEEREREAAEKRQREEEAEQQKQAAEQKAQQLVAETKQREAAVKQQREQTEKQRAADVQRKQREQADKRRAEQDTRAQAQREMELKRQLAEEEGRLQAANSGKLNEYRALIAQRIERAWIKPPSTQRGLECELTVTQAPGGAVLSVKLGKCNGDKAVQQSIEMAAHRASPLPLPPDARLFERVLTLNFRPQD
ncbi:MAG: cell envelope integrity protein TolA [Candidatus Obscuribacterales bacterium]|nr:cell envelope integrity protein TolA [Steroidobacteraceae bacterium]